MTNGPPIQICELNQYFSGLDLALSSSQGAFTFTKDSFPRPPNVLTSSAIEIRKSYRYIDDCWRVDVVNFCAEKITYRCFALAILAVVFRSDVPSLEVRLTGQSDINVIKISYPGRTPRAVFNYLTEPHSFEYHPQVLEENPWTGGFPDRGLPDFKLQYSGPRSWECWDERDEIVGFGNDEASVRLASMLLDFGSEANKLAIVRLESEAGYGGVSKLSAEAQFHLPESDQWPPIMPR